MNTVSRADSDLIEAAVRDGRLHPTSRAAYARDMKTSPKATRALLASLTPALPPAPTEDEQVARVCAALGVRHVPARTEPLSQLERAQAACGLRGGASS